MMIKKLNKLLLAAAFTAAVSISASAQKEGDKNPPPKEKPPVITPKEKPKEDRPKGDKKPSAMIANEEY